MKVFLHPKANKSLDKLDKSVRDEIIKKLKQLEIQNVGKHLEHCNMWAVRIGDYRVIYELDGERAIVLFIDHRKRVYGVFR